MALLPAVTGAIGAAGAVAGGIGALSDAGAGLGSDFSQNYAQTLIFPSDLISSAGASTDLYMTFRFGRYVKRSIQDPGALQDNGGSIRLPIPKNLHESTQATYSAEELGPAMGSVVEAASRSGSPTSASGWGSLVTKALGGYVEGRAVTAAAGLAGSQASGAVQAIAGLAVNPFQTMLFKHPNFRQFRFSWMLAPQSRKESDTLADIIATLKYHELPGLSNQSSGVFYSVPSMVTASINPAGNKYMFDFKPAVLTSVSVDYSPGQTPAFFKGVDAPVLVQLSIDMTEIELWTKRDFLTGLSQSTSSTTPAPAAPPSPSPVPAPSSAGPGLG